MGDENEHYEHIVNMHDQFSQNELSIEVDNNLYDKVCKGLRELKLSRLEDVTDLHDTCELAAEIEDYETVAVFEFVHARFKYDPQRLTISNEIFVHLDKLSNFSDRFRSLDERRRIKAMP